MNITKSIVCWDFFINPNKFLFIRQLFLYYIEVFVRYFSLYKEYCIENIVFTLNTNFKLHLRCLYTLKSLADRDGHVVPNRIHYSLPSQNLKKSGMRTPISYFG